MRPSTNLRFSKPPGALSLTSLMNIPFDPPRHPRGAGQQESARERYDVEIQP